MATLYALLPRDDRITSDVLLGRFLDYVAARRLTLYPAQEEAVLELFEEKNVILNTPTGSGKSLVAMALHFAALARGRRSAGLQAAQKPSISGWRELRTSKAERYASRRGP